MTIISRELDINDQIRAREVRVVGQDGEQIGVLHIRDALALAGERNLDLVQVAPNAKPPVCRIMDYGKYKYEQSKREREARKKQHTITLKELRMSPTIEENDLMTKIRRAKDFLSEGNKVKFTVRFRGRQLAHTELGRQVLTKIQTALEDVCVVESHIRMEGRNMTMSVGPKPN